MNRHVETTWCDDIRQEVGEKYSAMGVYTGVLLVPTFPMALPKLCLMLRIITPAEQPLRSVTMRILKDDAVLVETSLNEGQLTIPEPFPEMIPDNGERVRILAMPFMFSPFNLDTPCTLRVRIQTEAEELKGLGLRVTYLPGHIPAAAPTADTAALSSRGPGQQ